MSIFLLRFSFLNKNNNNNSKKNYGAKIKRKKLTDNDGWHQIARQQLIQEFMRFFLRQPE
jgi:hypothetical protein